MKVLVELRLILQAIDGILTTLFGSPWRAALFAATYWFLSQVLF